MFFSFKIASWLIYRPDNIEAAAAVRGHVEWGDMI